MPKLFTARHHAEAYLVQGLLEAQGIAAEVRGEALLTTVDAGALIPGAQPQVWVAPGPQVAQAQELVARYERGESLHGAGTPGWVCAGCGEVHEPQFASCWKCGAGKPAPAEG